MKRQIAFAAVFIISLALVSFLPLYVERTMMHVMFADGSGGAIHWGWKRCTLQEYWVTRRYMRREQNPAMWLGVNIALALGYASITTFAVSPLLARKILPSS